MKSGGKGFERKRQDDSFMKIATHPKLKIYAVVI
jgi:hypothetical protein